MKKWIEGFLGALLIATLVLMLNSLFQAQVSQPSTAPPLASALAQRATPTPALTWETATLEQIRFGEPRAVLTHTAGIKIYNWLPDNRRLLLELGTDDPILHNRIVTLDVETGQVVEYGRRPDRNIAPAWVESAQAVAYEFHTDQIASQLRLGFADGSFVVIEQTEAYPAVGPKSGILYYLAGVASGPILRAFDVRLKRPVSVPFKPGTDLRYGKLRLNRQETKVIGFLNPWVESGDLQTGQVRDYPLPNVGGVSKDICPPFVSEAQWSADGKTAAVIIGCFERGLIRFSKLYLLDTKTGEWRLVDLPVQFITELDWGPSTRHIMVMGADLPYGSAFETDTFWLVDIKTAKYKEFKWYPPEASLQWGTNMAWSPDGTRFGHIAVPSGQVVVRKITLTK